jgi:hypothetical protein
VVIDLILATVTKNSTTRGYSYKRIASKVSNTPGISKISASTVYRVLSENGYSSYKNTIKPGLKDEDKKKRLEWCMLRRH